MNSNIADINTILAGLGAGIVFFIFALLFIFFVMFILSYVFHSLAFYKFMKNRNLDNAFLAWIPVARAYAVGKVYDDINENQGKKTNYGIILLIVNCAFWVLSSTLSSSTSGLWLASMILHLMCYNVIFKTYTPNNSSYFVLSLIFTIIPIVPFIPGLCLLKASKNQPTSVVTSN